MKKNFDIEGRYFYIEAPGYRRLFDIKAFSSISVVFDIEESSISKFKFIYWYRRIFDIEGQIIYRYQSVSFDIEGSRPSISKFWLIILGPPGSPGSCRVADHDCWLQFSALHILQCNYFIAGECLSVRARPWFSRPSGGARGCSSSSNRSRSRRDASKAHAAWNLQQLVDTCRATLSKALSETHGARRTVCLSTFRGQSRSTCWCGRWLWLEGRPHDSTGRKPSTSPSRPAAPWRNCGRSFHHGVLEWVTYCLWVVTYGSTISIFYVILEQVIC